MSIEATSDFETLEERNKFVTETLDAKKKEVDEVNEVVKETMEAAKRLRDVCHGIFAQVDKEQEAWLKSQDDYTVEGLEAEISSEKARLELMHEGNGGVIREFEQRRRKIEGLTKTLNDYKEAKMELDQVISASQNEWEPKLDHLAQQISEAFSFNMQQINCAGEVGVWKDEDFDQWAIQIRVKFRYFCLSRILNHL